MVKNNVVMANTNGSRWFSIVGNNGMCITAQEFRLLEAIRKLTLVTVMEFSDTESARGYAYAAYLGRFFMRNNHLGIVPQLPLNLPAECLWMDPDYEAREGNRGISGYFPGIAV